MSEWLARAVTGLVGAVVEAWAELRIHKTRVLLSLIGVGVAVCALTSVVAFGSVAEQALRESSERSGGRAATIGLSANSMDGSVIDADLFTTAYDEALKRYDVTYSSAHNYASPSVQFPDGVVPTQAELVDQPYGEMHRVSILHGDWFTEADTKKLAPSLVVNTRFWERIGSPPLSTHPTVSLVGETDTVAVIVGVIPSNSYETDPRMYMLNSQATALGLYNQNLSGPPQYELWVPESVSDELTTRLTSDLTAALGEGVAVNVYRNDYAEQNAQALEPIKLVVSGVAVLVLLLGALGLVNIALVTVRQRIREIGVRRTFGATAGRVFFAVMMESVVATVAAGIVGVMAAILIVKNPWVESLIADGVSDLPPFPIEAALLGLGAAVVVGAIAGLLPALVAVRVKVIDAIRY